MRAWPSRPRLPSAFTSRDVPPGVAVVPVGAGPSPPRLQTVYDERFAPEYGPGARSWVRVAEKFLACGILEHGFARIRCDDCAHEYLMAFSCKCHYFCPSCHAKRLVLWTQWLDTTLLAPVPHRQVVLTLPKRLRVYCLYRRHLLGAIARVAARTVTAAIRTLTDERDLADGVLRDCASDGWGDTASKAG